MRFSNDPLVFLDGNAYGLDVYRAEPDLYQVALVSGGRPVLTFIGTAHELHGLFLGLHNVLVDAGHADSGRSTLTIPVTTPKGDERGGSIDE